MRWSYVVVEHIGGALDQLAFRSKVVSLVSINFCKALDGVELVGSVTVLIVVVELLRGLELLHPRSLLRVVLLHHADRSTVFVRFAG